jgi:CRISPR-associated protein Csb1
MATLTQFDHYLTHDGPAALVQKQHLMPVEGTDGVLFPATFASGDGFEGGYNIDNFDGTFTAKFKYKPDGKEEVQTEFSRDTGTRNVALIDSVGAQANRIETMFMTKEYDGKYAHLVPQIVVQAGDKEVSILEAGHRAGDALVRCSSLQPDLQAAFKAVQNGDATLLAKIAPTSLVFGVWDSRDTQAKLPRVIASTIRAFDVRKLTRSAQFNPATDYVGGKLLDEPADKATKDAYAERGFVHVPATGSHGGVIADGGVLRTATLGLAALRLLHAGKDKEKTLALRRYVLGLSLVAFTHSPSGYLRQGCLLVVNGELSGEFVEVHPNGDRKPCGITHDQAIKFATEAAKAFGVGESKTVPFDVERAKRDIKGGAAEGDSAKGKITGVDATGKRFTIGKGAKKVEVLTTNATGYFKGDTESTFEIVVVKDASVEVVLSNGNAIKVTAK